MKAADLERNLLAIALEGDVDAACEIILGVEEDDLTEGLGRWLLGELAKRVGRGHSYHDLIPYADEKQAEYLGDLHSRYVTAGTAGSLLGELKTASNLRQARDVLGRGLERVKGGDPKAIEDTLGGLVEIMTPRLVRRIYNAGEILGAARKRIEDMRAGKLAKYTMLGMLTMEKLLAIQPGQLVILGAGTGVGKTALALTWTYGMAFVHGMPVLYLNSEMGTEEIGLRLTSISKNIPLGRLRADPTDDDWAAISAMIEDYRDAPAFTSEPIGELTSSEVVALTKYHRVTQSVRVLVVDYIQRLRDWQTKEIPQWQMFMEISRALKILAADEKIIVICLAQLNSMGELAASKGMANDADLVLGLERCAEGQTTADGQTHLLTVVKGRHIPTGMTFPLEMDKNSLRFREVG